MAEVYAGFCSYTDHEIGRLIDYLESTGELDNTLIVVISDNGASGEGGPNGSVNENNFFNSVVDDIDENMKYLDRLGSPDTYNHYPIGWAMAFNTPFKLWKRHSWNGGICDPMIVHWPAGIQAKGEIREQYTHCSDVVPTVYECFGLEPPDRGQGLHAVAARRHELQVQLRRCRRAVPEGHPVLRDARHPRHLAPGLEGRGDAPCGARQLEPLHRGPLGALQHRGRPLGVPRSR